MGRRNRLRGYVRNRETGRVDRSAVGYKSFLWVNVWPETGLCNRLT